MLAGHLRGMFTHMVCTVAKNLHIVPGFSATRFRFFNLIKKKKQCESHRYEQENDGGKCLFCPISARGLEADLSGCIQILQQVTDKDRLWGIIRLHATFQIGIFQGTF